MGGPAIDLPYLFSFQGQTLETKRFLEEMETTGLIVLKDDRVVFEQYWLGNDAKTQTASWSTLNANTMGTVRGLLGRWPQGS